MKKTPVKMLLEETACKNVLKVVDQNESKGKWLIFYAENIVASLWSD